MATAGKLEKVRNKALSWVEGKGYTSIRSSFEEDLDDPKSFMRSSDGTEVVPHITAVSQTGKSYFEIAQKTKNEQRLITKWKLLSHLASAKNGQFVIFAPYGHKTFTEKIVEQYNITAKVVSI